MQRRVMETKKIRWAMLLVIFLSMMIFLVPAIQAADEQTTGWTG